MGAKAGILGIFQDSVTESDTKMGCLAPDTDWCNDRRHILSGKEERGEKRKLQSRRETT